MDTSTIFVLGSLSSLGIILLGFGIYKILKMNKRIKELETLPKEIDNLYQKGDGNFTALHNSIDALNTQIRSYVDSRFDKIITNVSTEISNDRRDIGNLQRLIEEIASDHGNLQRLIEEIASDHSDRLATLETFKKIDDDKIEQINS
jgi:prefoldin subunit 5